MKFQEYLTEATFNKEAFDMMWSNLMADCDEYVKILKKSNTRGKFLWRGTNDRVKTFKKIKPRKDRIPKDTPEEIHELLDELFKKYHGWKARSEGVFVTSNKSDAYAYGDAYLFFPFNGYKFLWNSSISDLWSDIENEGYHLEEMPYEEYDYEQEYGEGGNGQWQYDGIDTGTPDESEAREIAAEAEGIDIEEIDYRDLKWIPELTYEEWAEEKEQDWTDLRRDWFEVNVKNYKNKNLLKAIESGNEMMFKCKYYYLVNSGFEYYINKEVN